jgi:hypothetical protein
LRFRSAGHFSWHIEELTFASKNPENPSANAYLAAVQVERINSVLQDRSLDVVVDFGPFGHFVASGIARKARSVSFSISRQLRDRIEWLCKASGAHVDAQRRPVGTLNDADLVLHLSGLVVPIPLIAHRRALERDLRRYRKASPTP